MPAPISLPIAHASQSYWWASRQGFEGAHDRITAEISLESLRMIYRAKVSDRLTSAAFNSLCLIEQRRSERRGAVG